MLLALAAAIGVPVSALAYFFLYFVSYLQKLIFVQLPVDVGFKGEPVWWPLPILMVSGLLVASCIKYLPGTSGHSPADGLQFGGGAPSAAELPGVVLAALATLALGVVLGPEAPLIALGGGLGVIAVRLAKRDAPPATAIVMAAAGSFAAVSTLFGSPILGAFLLMEASGLGGPLMGLILVPGLLSAGIGFLIFDGLNAWTGLGAFSLAIPDLPTFSTPDVAEFGSALVIGLAAAVVGVAIHRLARSSGAGNQAHADAHTSGRSRHRPGRDGIRGRDRTWLVDRVVLRAIRPSLVGATRSRLDGWCTGAAGPVQSGGLRGVVEQLQGWSRLPLALHRCRRWHGPVARRRSAARSRCGHGHRRHVRGHAETAAHLGPSGWAVGGQGCCCSHAVGDRGRHCRVMWPRPAHPVGEGLWRPRRPRPPRARAAPA